MHPPDFHLGQRLSDWPECRIEASCRTCSGRTVVLPVRMLLEERGDRQFGSVIAGLRCTGCCGKPAPVYLVAGLARTFCYGPPPCWAVELVPP